jgi:multidrug efflux pump subunit AcrA (membrane-fusion protein)
VRAGRAEAVPVEPGAALGDQVELRQGPPAGTRVVVNPPEDLQSGDRVETRP